MDLENYLYHGRECEIDDVVFSLSSGGKVRIKLEDEDDYQSFSGITQRSGKRAGQILMVMYRSPDEKEFSRIDGWFAGWTVSHTKGCVIAITLDEEGFDALRTLSKGAPLEIVIYQIEDDGTTVNEARRRRVESTLKGGPLSIQAGKACQDPSFHRLLESELGHEKGSVDAKQAATIVRSHCKVESRAELDHNPKAAALWKPLYRRWLAQDL